MKEATGELNMTVVTLVAVAAIAAVFAFVLWPLIQKALVSQTCRTTYGSSYSAVRQTDGEGANLEGTGTGDNRVYKWKCCPEGDPGSDKCVVVENEG